MYTHPTLMAMLAEQRQADLIREARRYRQADLIREARRYRRADSVPRTRYTGAFTRWVSKAQAALNRPKTVAGRPSSTPSGSEVACCA